MDPVKAQARTRRQEYAESTRRALLDSGLRLFLERGYAEVSAEELVRAAGLTRGALYHHFEGKRGLFEAVFEEAEERAARRIGEATGEPTGGCDDLWDRTLAGLDAFLEVCAEPAYREIVLLQGPIALGWRRWRELDQHHLGGLLLDAVRALQDAGLIRPHSAELTAAALYGALTEISLVTAHAGETTETVTETSDAGTAHADAMRLAHTLLNALRA